MRLWRPVWCWLLCSCALPDYQIVADTESGVEGEPDGGALRTAAPMARPATNSMARMAPSECLSCAESECGEQRTSCAKDCDNLAWPISPAWLPPKASHGYVKCLASKCDAQCNLLWGCVDAYSWAEPSEAYNVTLRVANAFSGYPDVGARVTACQAGDPGCGAGNGMASSNTTDDDGRVTLTLDRGFSGYFLIEPHDPKYYPMTMLWSQPAYRVDRTFTVTMFERTWLDAMATTLEVPKKDETHGHVIFRAENCLPIEYLGQTDAPAEADDVMVSLSRTEPDTSPVFYTRYAMSVEPTLRMSKATGGAYGGALNLPPAALTLVASHNEQEVMHATVRMRANTVALVHLVPDGR